MPEDKEQPSEPEITIRNKDTGEELTGEDRARALGRLRDNLIRNAALPLPDRQKTIQRLGAEIAQSSAEPDAFEGSGSENLTQLIASSPQAIAAEYARTGNSWLACYGSVVFQLETQVALLGDQAPFGAMQRLEDVKLRLDALKAKQPDQLDTPDEATQKDLIARLDILADDYPELLADGE